MAKLTPIPEHLIKRIPAAPAGSSPKSLYALQREEERALELGYSGRVEMLQGRSSDAERASERYVETVCQARLAGLSTSDALDEGRDS